MNVNRPFVRDIDLAVQGGDRNDEIGSLGPSATIGKAMVLELSNMKYTPVSFLP